MAGISHSTRRVAAGRTTGSSAEFLLRPVTASAFEVRRRVGLTTG